MSQTVALIPARGASKGLPGKNIKPLQGKPLIHYTLEAALACPQIDAVYVSTEDPDIAQTAAQLAGVNLVQRPDELATDNALTMAVVQHFLEIYRTEHKAFPETVVLLQPTSPLRTSAHIQEALLRYSQLPKPATLVSVTRTKPLSWQCSITPDGQIQFRQSNVEKCNRQQEDANFVLNGALYCTSAHRFYHNELFASPVYPYVMSAEASIDIDTLADFRLAEILLSKEAITCQSAPFSEMAT